jgi:hypothetical protein
MNNVIIKLPNNVHTLTNRLSTIIGKFHYTVRDLAVRRNPAFQKSQGYIITLDPREVYYIRK